MKCECGNRRFTNLVMKTAPAIASHHEVRVFSFHCLNCQQAHSFITRVSQYVLAAVWPEENPPLMEFILAKGDLPASVEAWHQAQKEEE